MNRPARRVAWHTDAVFAVMREIGREADRLDERSKSRLPRGGLPVGGAHMDDFLPSNALHEFLRALRRGYRPDTAALLAKAATREAVRTWNRQRGTGPIGGLDAHRWEGTCDDIIAAAARKVEKSI